MKSSLKILSGLFFITSILYCTKRDKQEINISIINNAVVFKENKNIESAKLELKTALIKNEILPDKVISNSETAVNVAEIVLFSIYGKENIIKQRPYDVDFIDEYYIINGTMPETSIGGTFKIIINSKDGKVIKLIHGE